MGGLILTDPTVWTSKACSALAAVPVIPVDAGSAVVAAEIKKKRVQFLHQDTPRIVSQTDISPLCFRTISGWNFLTSQHKIAVSQKAIKAIRLVLFIGQVCMGLGVSSSGVWLNKSRAWEFTKEV